MQTAEIMYSANNQDDKMIDLSRGVTNLGSPGVMNFYSEPVDAETLADSLNTFAEELETGLSS
jgi:hypothetical protein